jgi:hypothetical protein
MTNDTGGMFDCDVHLDASSFNVLNDLGINCEESPLVSTGLVVISCCSVVTFLHACETLVLSKGQS